MIGPDSMNNKQAKNQKRKKIFKKENKNEERKTLSLNVPQSGLCIEILGMR